jgi:TPP-dependent 2-oxoacid decarboxylase
MPHTYTVGNYLLDRLKELGIKHIFGVPGDYNLGFLDQIELTSGLEWIGNCNELNAAYATDGYARLNGIGALVTTMGVGELSAINGIAGSYAEQVPVIQIAGIAALNDIKTGSVIHHTLGDGNYTHFSSMAKEVTAAQTTLTPEKARSEIDRVLRVCWQQKLPVHINLPVDLCAAATQPPESPLVLDDYGSNPAALEDFLARAATRLAIARRPAILADYEVGRYHLTEQLRQLVEATGFPLALFSTGKGVFDETHDQYIGIYQGELSDPEVKQRIEEADCLLCIGAKFTDVGTGGFSHHLDPHNIIELHPGYACIGQTFFQNVTMKDVLERLIDRLPHRDPAQLGTISFNERVRNVQSSFDPQPATLLKQTRFWQAISRFIKEDDVLLADTGTPFYGTLTLPLPAKTSIVGQPFWASIGYTLPALLGTLLAAPQRRQILFIGDGAFQMTAQELSTILRQGFSPVIMLINNDGYTIERVIHGREQHYNDIQAWQYHKLPALFAAEHHPVSIQVTNEDELIGALRDVDQHPGHLYFIEVMMHRDDAPENLQHLGEALAARNGFAESRA